MELTFRNFLHCWDYVSLVLSLFLNYWIWSKVRKCTCKFYDYVLSDSDDIY